MLFPHQNMTLFRMVNLLLSLEGVSHANILIFAWEFEFVALEAEK
jgi:hypothetical protein